VTGTANATYTDVSDSNACGDGTTNVLATGGTNTNSGGNSCWVFGAIVFSVESSALFENYNSAYDHNVVETAVEFQKAAVNSIITNIRSKYSGKGIVHTHDWMAGGAIVAYAKSRNIPTLHTIHNIHTAEIPCEFYHGINLNALKPNLYVSKRRDKHFIDSQATAILSADCVSVVGQKFLEEVVGDYFLDHKFIPVHVRDAIKKKFHKGQTSVIPNGVDPILYPENLFV